MTKPDGAKTPGGTTRQTYHFTPYRDEDSMCDKFRYYLIHSGDVDKSLMNRRESR